jgi:hypothetical protein
VWNPVATTQPVADNKSPEDYTYNYADVGDFAKANEHLMYHKNKQMQYQLPKKRLNFS